MNKNIYSLVLMDDVIAAVDREAYRLGTSRSNLINQILAEHLCCVTPEMRMKQIFGYIIDSLGGSYQIRQQNSDSLLTIRTALQYKYNPTVNYKVELLRSPDEFIGQLKVQIRTQSSAVLKLFESFFSFWTELEAEILSQKISSASYSLSAGRFTRMLCNTNIPDELLGEAVHAYITLLDRALKLFFSDNIGFKDEIPTIYNAYLAQTQKFII